MLLLIGLGLDTKDISVRALAALKSADLVFIERYTSFIDDSYVKYLEEATDKKIIELHRPDLEEDIAETLARAKDHNVAVLFPGDPLIATTHKTILSSAKELGIKVTVFHAPSILTVAIGLSGLDVYRFGSIATIPFWSEKYRPTSFLDVVKRNLDRDEHTLLLLDIDRTSNKPMKLGYAMQILKEAERQKRYEMFHRNADIIVIADAGKENAKVIRTSFRDAQKHEAETEGKALSIIVVSKTSFAEEEALKSLGPAL